MKTPTSTPRHRPTSAGRTASVLDLALLAVVLVLPLILLG